MATSSPPAMPSLTGPRPPRARSKNDPLSTPLGAALDLMDDFHAAGIAFAPLMPDAEALRAAARAAGITPAQALAAYLTILNHD